MQVLQHGSVVRTLDAPGRAPHLLLMRLRTTAAAAVAAAPDTMTQFLHDLYNTGNRMLSSKLWESVY